ncbi:MAG TPA: allantoicase [Vicinamibacterales bacterium]|nr:allantoicase [Vicinamibacterales bacterium]
MSEFSHLIDLASERLGGRAIAANDEFFAEKERLVRADTPIFVPDKYTDRGKWMDGWETRRRRTPGHDWCIVRLGLPGIVHALVVDTAFFRGNYPPHCSIDGCGLPADADATAAAVMWEPLLPRSELAGDAKNVFPVDATARSARRVTHVRLNIFPDGGVARLRVMGETLPEWTHLLATDEEIDLAAAVHGGYIVDASDRFFGEPRNMLMPYPAANMGEGWETKRRRDPGHDWAVIRLGIPGVVTRVELDTAHFKGNYPDSASIDAAAMPDETGGVSADVSTKAIADWKPILPQATLQPDHLHVFAKELASGQRASHVRLNIYPDGGVSRFRVFGAPTAEGRRHAVLRQLNAMDAQELRRALADFCGAPSWIDRMIAARPFASPAAVLAASESAAAAESPDGWREAFRHHPRIGERVAERAQSAAAREASAAEQSIAASGSPADLQALADANRAYEDRFGHVFIVCASGKTAPEILALLRERLKNDPDAELLVAAGEQRRITRLRLEKLLG